MTRHLRLLGSDHHLAILFRQFPGALWTTDCDLHLTYVTGRLSNNMIPRARRGMSVQDIAGPIDPENRIVYAHRAAIAGEPQSFEFEADGRTYRFLIEQLKDASGELTGCIGTAFDITEQRATRDRLARSDALLAQAQRVAHIGSFEWDVRLNALMWSDELQRIYGLKPDEFAGTYEAFMARVHPDDVERTKSVIFDAMRTVSPFVYDHRIIRPDGSIRVLHTRGEVVSGENGQPVRLVGCCWDVTEQRETMDRLERTRSLLEATIEATADGILVMDVDGNVTLYNRRLLSLWRLPHRPRFDDQTMLAHIREQLEDPDEFQKCAEDLRRHPEKESFNVQRFKDGRVFERYSRPQRIGQQIVGRVWSFRDVTEREKLLRRAVYLSDATRLLTSLDIEPALDSVARLSIPFMGDGCAIDLFGNGQPRRVVYASGDGAGSICPELTNAVMAGHSTIYSMGTRSCMAVPLLVKDSVVGAITFVGRPMFRHSDTDLALAETLARRAALAVENSRLYKQAQEALRARDELMTIAAHEIRGPITSVHLAVQGLKAGKVPNSAQPKVLEIIEREDRKLSRFVNELLDLGKIQGGQMRFILEQVDLGDVVRDAAGNLGSELTRSGSALSITTQGQPVGYWDRYGVDQVATNLLSNAIKFGQGKPIAVTVREHDGLTTLEVQDHGIGIDPDTLDRIFKPFERGVSLRNYGGLGLGLYIVRTIVEGLGGIVRVNSKPNEGSTFTVELRNERTNDNEQNSSGR
jgi:PAS domain S-box-containing protein